MRKILIIPLLWLFCLTIFAQQEGESLTISGVVCDEMQATLPGVSIHKVDRPGVGTITDVNGAFSIKANKGDVLAFTFIGYNQGKYLVTKSDQNLKIVLTSSNATLDEAVVVGLGTQRKASVVGAITSVSAKDLQSIPATSINNLLGGRVPGIISLQTSGEPGKNISEFWVRGIGTFGASSGALVLIDGLEGDLSQIDPADIESFSVLKDASATAVYGVRGANGVVLVTTKRGQEDRMAITYRSNVSLSHLTRMPKYLGAYDYAKLANEANVVRGNDVLYDKME